MEFFDKLSKKASEAYKITADKTGKIAKETKLKLKLSELRGKIDDIYEEIGKKVYESHLLEEEDKKTAIKEELEELCIKIDVLSDEVEDLLQQCLELKDKKQCKNCYVEMEKEYKYCPNCGAKQDEEEQEKEEKLQNRNYNEDEEKKEEKEEKQEDLENLEKTIVIESNVEDNENKNENKIDTETY